MTYKEPYITTATNNVLDYLSNNGDLRKGEISAFRSSIDLTSPRMTKLYPIIFRYLTTSLSGNGIPSYSEIALFTAIQTYSYLQQGQNHTIFDKENQLNFFKALKKASYTNSKIKDSVDKRVNNLLSSVNNIKTVQNSLRQIIHLAKADLAKFNINYGNLAYELYLMQFSSENAKRISLKWGQDYYA